MNFVLIPSEAGMKQHKLTWIVAGVPYYHSALALTGYGNGYLSVARKLINSESNSSNGEVLQNCDHAFMVYAGGEARPIMY